MAVVPTNATQPIIRPACLQQWRSAPSPYELAILSKHVYLHTLSPGDPVSLVTEQGTHLLEGWKVLEILGDEGGSISDFFTALGLPYGYAGVLYYNESKKQLVLAHRGTQKLNVSALHTDIRSIAQNMHGGQQRVLLAHMERATSIAQDKSASLSVTGHSLGGWLTQISAFLGKEHFPGVHVKAVAFDAPSAYPMLNKINHRVKEIPLDELDLIFYLSSPNPINCCHGHYKKLGTLYRVIFQPFTTTPVKYALQSHSMDNFVQAFDPQSGREIQCELVEDWPVIDTKSVQALKGMKGASRYKITYILLFFLYKLNQGEALGEYSGFFNYGNQGNLYAPNPAPLPRKDVFILGNEYHYKLGPFDSTTIDRRHIPFEVCEFLQQNSNGRVSPLRTVYNWTGRSLSIPQGDVRRVVEKVAAFLRRHSAPFRPIPVLMRVFGFPCFDNSFVYRRNVDRQNLLDEIERAFEQDKPVLLHGAIGNGKSHLAKSYLSKHCPEYDSFFYLNGSSLAELEKSYKKLAGELGLTIVGDGFGDVRRKVHEALQGRRWLLIYDDLECNIPLPTGVHVLVTSRKTHSTKDFYRIEVPGFSGEEAPDLCPQMSPEGFKRNVDGTAGSSLLAGAFVISMLQNDWLRGNKRFQSSCQALGLCLFDTEIEKRLRDEISRLAPIEKKVLSFICGHSNRKGIPRQYFEKWLHIAHPEFNATQQAQILAKLCDRSLLLYDSEKNTYSIPVHFQKALSILFENDDYSDQKRQALFQLIQEEKCLDLQEFYQTYGTTFKRKEIPDSYQEKRKRTLKWARQMVAINPFSPPHLGALPTALKYKYCKTIGIVFAQGDEKEKNTFLAIQFLGEALKLKRELVAPGDPSLLEDLFRLGYFYTSLCGCRPSQYFAEAYDIQKKTLAATDPVLLETMFMWAKTLSMEGENELAIKKYEELYSIQKRTFGGDDPRLEETWTALERELDARINEVVLEAHKLVRSTNPPSAPMAKNEIKKRALGNSTPKLEEILKMSKRELDARMDEVVLEAHKLVRSTNPPSAPVVAPTTSEKIQAKREQTTPPTPPIVVPATSEECVII